MEAHNPCHNTISYLCHDGWGCLRSVSLSCNCPTRMDGQTGTLIEGKICVRAVRYAGHSYGVTAQSRTKGSLSLRQHCPRTTPWPSEAHKIIGQHVQSMQWLWQHSKGYYGKVIAFLIQTDFLFMNTRLTWRMKAISYTWKIMSYITAYRH